MNTVSPSVNAATPFPAGEVLVRVVSYVPMRMRRGQMYAEDAGILLSQVLVFMFMLPGPFLTCCNSRLENNVVFAVFGGIGLLLTLWHEAVARSRHWFWRFLVDTVVIIYGAVFVTNVMFIALSKSPSLEHFMWQLYSMPT
ncbi:MAG: hypothetical protein ACAI35_04495 [Candidatus Methylacidiphilales bacterium]